MFAENFWDAFEVAYTKVAEGKTFSSNAAGFLHKLMAIEREYGKKLLSLCRSMNDKDFGTLDQCWNTVKNELETVGKKHLDHSEQLNIQVVEPINAWLKEKLRPRREARDRGRRLVKELQSAESKLSAAKSTYEKDKKRQDDTQDEYDKAPPNSPQIEKLAKKLNTDTKKAQASDKKYMDAVNFLASVQSKYYDDEMPRVLTTLEEMELSRIECMKGCMIHYSQLFSEFSPLLASCATNITNSSNSVDAKADIEAFTNERASRKPKPERAEYEPYNSAAGKCMKKSTGGGGAASAAAATSPAAGGFQPGRGPVVAAGTPPGGATPFAAAVGAVPTSEPTRSSPTAASPAAAPAATQSVMCRVRALYDYQASEPTELSFNAGDIINVLQKDPSGWWQGELNGRVGAFPSVDWVEEIGDGQKSGSVGAASGTGTLGRCKALYLYEAEDSNEITINAGDILTVDADEDGWFVGQNTTSGGYGRFPSNFVEMLS